MQMYESYLESQTEEEAKKMVADIIEEYYRYFSPETLVKKDVIQVIEKKIKSFTALLNQQADYDHQLYYAEKIDALEEALHILKEDEEDLHG